MKRRNFIAAVGVSGLGLSINPMLAVAQQQKKFTEWGMPLPYEMVSASSIAFLKEKGWWPIKIGSQPGFTSLPVAGPKGFFKSRGLEVEVISFLSGPAINEAAAAGRIQGGIEGNLPFTSLIANNAQVKCLAIAAPVLKHSTMVPLNSPLKSLADIKQAPNKPLAFGIVAGSSAEFYFQEALKTNGLEVGKDVILKSLTPPDLLLMPDGLAGVVQWAPYTWTQTKVRKNAREIDTIFPYNFYQGNVWMIKEIIDKAPDVAQAFVDAYVEGILYSRYDEKDANAITEKDPMYKSFTPELIALLTRVVNNSYKPTWFYPFTDFWATENSRVSAWLAKSGRLKTLVTAEMYKEYFDTRFADRTMQKLGWKVPQRPPWIPANWAGKIGQLPYPSYPNEDNMTEPQLFPDKGDLISPWYFNGRNFKPS
jgi:sulfonate transport system substrate-binding protein